MKLAIRSALFSLVIMAACSSEPEKNFTIEGTVKNFDQLKQQYPAAFQDDSLKLYLYEVPFGSENNPLQLDTVFITAGNTSFVLEAATGAMGIYDIMIENGPIIPLVNDADKIRVDIDLLNRERYYSVENSPASEQVRDFIFNYSDKTAAANMAFNRLDSLKLYQAGDSLVLAATNEKNSSVESVNNYLKNVLASVDNSTVAAFILGTASNTLSENEFEILLNRLAQKYPADPNIIYLKQQLDGKKTATASVQPNPNSLLGKPAPELILPDVTGKNVSVSSFRGKFVLVDFWASWCRPCRVENPNIVKAHNQYKNRNFTVLGVSLDKEKGNWLEAIKEDQLAWTHISDLAFWNSIAVETYQFEGIPYNVLINPEGIIIGEGLRGAQLETKLEEVLPK